VSIEDLDISNSQGVRINFYISDSSLLTTKIPKLRMDTLFLGLVGGIVGLLGALGAAMK
jgi:hypothetical protein